MLDALLLLESITEIKIIAPIITINATTEDTIPPTIARVVLYGTTGVVDDGTLVVVVKIVGLTVVVEGAVGSFFLAI